MMARANQEPGLRQVFTLFETSTPQLYLDIDRAKAEMLGINTTDVFSALQVYHRVGLCQRLQPVRPHLPGDRAGRFAVPRGRARRAQSAGAQQQRRHRAARLVHDGAHHVRAVPGAALQSLSRRRARRHRGAGLFAGPGDRDHGEARGRGAARRLQLRMDDARVPADREPAARRRSPSRWRWCSCSWCSPRSTRA